MFDALRRNWREGREAWRGLRAFEALPRDARRLVFYAETAADWAHLGSVAAALERRGTSLVRITSDARDPVLQRGDAFFVGMGTARTVFFRTLDADALVLTLTDLDRFHLKRSVHGVHYFYVFHSIASTHRVYREHAFDAYDTLFCVGPHHLTEIRRMEEIDPLPPKRLLPHGYGRLDTLMHDLAAARIETKPATTRVLVAPSWGACSLVQHGLDSLLETLLSAGFEVSLRLHPMTVRHHPRLAEELVKRHEHTGRFHYDPDVSTTQALLDADIMISEWSGAPLEYAFARQRPVIFIDTPAKIHNPHWERIGLPALEADIREQIGRIVAPGDTTLPDVVRALLAETDAWSERIAAVRDRVVFNVGRSGDVAAAHVLDTLAAMRSGDG